MTFDRRDVTQPLGGNTSGTSGHSWTDCPPPIKVNPAAPLRIVIEATASGRKWTARLDDRVLWVTASPFVKSARLLLDEGYSADAVIEMWRPNTDEWALRGRLGAAAATVIDGETGSRSAKNGSAVHDSEKSGPPEACCWSTFILGPFLARPMTTANEATSNPSSTVRAGPREIGRTAARRSHRAA